MAHLTRSDRVPDSWESGAPDFNNPFPPFSQQDLGTKQYIIKTLFKFQMAVHALLKGLFWFFFPLVLIPSIKLILCLCPGQELP